MLRMKTDAGPSLQQVPGGSRTDWLLIGEVLGVVGCKSSREWREALWRGSGRRLLTHWVKTTFDNVHRFRGTSWLTSALQGGGWFAKVRGWLPGGWACVSSCLPVSDLVPAGKSLPVSDIRCLLGENRSCVIFCYPSAASVARPLSGSDHDSFLCGQEFFFTFAIKSTLATPSSPQDEI